MDVSRLLIGLGVLLLVLGLLWPLFGRLGLGRLPGDIVIERETTTVYIPIMTGLLLSLVLSLVLSALWWLSGR